MKPVSPAATYAALLPDLVQAAREVGYALAPHGSISLVRSDDVCGNLDQLSVRLDDA